jgi:hypothetical protein
LTFYRPDIAYTVQ